MPGVNCGLADRVKQLRTQTASGHRSETDRGVVGSKRGSAGVSQGLVQAPGQHGQSIDVAEFALICAETQGGITLHMLD